MEQPVKQRRIKRNLRVDLLVLITCFSTLAAVAVPRHVSISQQARRSDVAALSRSIEGAAELAHNLWQAADQPALLTTKAGQLVMINGYPTIETLPLLLEDSESMGFSLESGYWQHGNLVAERNCRVFYGPPDSPGGRPSITVDDSGC